MDLLDFSIFSESSYSPLFRLSHLIRHILIIRLTHRPDSLPLYYLYHSSQWSKQRLYLLYGLQRIFKPPMPYPVILMVSTRTCTRLDSSLHSFSFHLSFRNRSELYAELSFFFSLFLILFRSLLNTSSFLQTLHFLLITSFSTSFSFSASITDVEGVGLQTEGVNFEAIWAMSSKFSQANQIKCNDIWRMLNTFGIESAMASIVTEVQGQSPLSCSLSYSLLFIDG